MDEEEMVVSAEEMERRTLRRGALVSCSEAFIDFRTPGAEKKQNYALIGGGVSQNDGQFVHLPDRHGFNLGAVTMPVGNTNSLHLHFTAEVFFNFGGEWLFRWGDDGSDGEYRSQPGDVISIPQWIFRGFTNLGPDDGWLFTVLGRDDPGGVVWAPSVLQEASRHGLYLGVDGTLIDTVGTDSPPTEEQVVRPLPGAVLETLTRYDEGDFRRRVVTSDDRVWTKEPFLCSRLPGGGAEVAPVIGWGIGEKRDTSPPLLGVYGFSVEWLRAEPGEGLLLHRLDRPQVLIGYSGRWQVTSNRTLPVQAVLDRHDTLSVVPGSWRSITNVGPEPAEMIVVTGGDERPRIEWDPTVEQGAARGNTAIDADGYLARRDVIERL